MSSKKDKLLVLTFEDFKCELAFDIVKYKYVFCIVMEINVLLDWISIILVGLLILVSGRFSCRFC